MYSFWIEWHLFVFEIKWQLKVLHQVWKCFLLVDKDYKIYNLRGPNSLPANVLFEIDGVIDNLPTLTNSYCKIYRICVLLKLRRELDGRLELKILFHRDNC